MKVLSKFVPSGRFFVLVSGGVDSIAAAHWLKYVYRKDFDVLHFNHNVQNANHEMEDSVRRFCSDFGLNCVSIFNTQGGSNWTEASLREWRLSHMRELCGSYVTGHHLNDAVENYLTNCLSGTPEYKPISELTNFPTFSIYHPFLTTTKAEMISYVERMKLLEYIVTDPTNDDTKYRRNWVRNIIIPEIDKRNIGIETVVKKKFYD
jgi:tRNA(Ile)-lysidine synthase